MYIDHRNFWTIFSFPNTVPHFQHKSKSVILLPLIWISNKFNARGGGGGGGRGAKPPRLEVREINKHPKKR